jgi:hypothetical protein
MDDYIEAYLINQTDKARLLQIEATGEQIWVPMSLIDYFKVDPVPEHLAGKIPGSPVLMKVASWFIRKNPKAFGT